MLNSHVSTQRKPLQTKRKAMWVKESRMADRKLLKGHTTWSDYIGMVPGVFVKPYNKSFTLNEAWITTQSVRRFCFGLAKPSILHAGLFGREVSELLHVEAHSWSAWGDTGGRTDRRTDGRVQPRQCMNYFSKAFTPACLWFTFWSSLTHSLHVNLLTFICTMSLCSVC